jgi:hypothetical protein
MRTNVDLCPVIHLEMGCGVGDAIIDGFHVDGQTACLVAQANILDALAKGRSISEPTDKLDCACPMLRRLAIYLNDGNWWTDDQERTERLRPLIPLLLDSVGDLDQTKRRGMRYLDFWVREITPAIFDRVGKRDISEKLRSLSPIMDEKTTTHALQVCLSISSALDSIFDHDIDRTVELEQAVALVIALGRALDITVALDLIMDLAVALPLLRALAGVRQITYTWIAIASARAADRDLREKLIALFEELARL